MDGGRKQTQRWRTLWIVMCVGALLALAFSVLRLGSTPSPPGQEAVRVSRAGAIVKSVTPRSLRANAERAEGTVADAGTDDAPTKQVSLTPIPPIGTRAKQKTWVRAEYGEGEHMLGYTPIPPGGAGESRAPQGFTITSDGELLVLDSEKKRLLWFDADAQIKRTLALEGLVMPADVAVAADGTIAVMDHEGLHTKGTLLLAPNGKVKSMLPQSGGGMITELYAVGADILGYAGNTIKLGETSGAPSHETPGLYQQDGTIPGRVAPDRRTVIDASIHSRQDGIAYVTVLRSDPPEHVFSRLYSVPVKDRLSGIEYVQSDNAGTIYLVLYYDDAMVLVCIEGGSGDPLGSVALPMSDDVTGTAFKQFTVNREQGGLVYHRLLEGASSFEVYDCR